MPRYTESEASEAVRTSLCYSEALRKLGLPAGGNHKIFRRYVDDVWKISTAHFDSERVRQRAIRQQRPIPIGEVLVPGSSYNRRQLKLRLFSLGLKAPRCEFCGQDEMWRGQRMGLILDHINGVPDDHRLENLRILCPNCAGTLDTHCARKNRQEMAPRPCLRCGVEFPPKTPRQRYCSVDCGRRGEQTARPRFARRKVERPPYERLRTEVDALGFSAVGRKYGVSDNAVRKWVRQYEAARRNDPG